MPGKLYTAQLLNICRLSLCCRLQDVARHSSCAIFFGSYLWWKLGFIIKCSFKYAANFTTLAMPGFEQKFVCTYITNVVIITSRFWSWREHSPDVMTISLLMRDGQCGARMASSIAMCFSPESRFAYAYTEIKFWDKYSRNASSPKILRIHIPIIGNACILFYFLITSAGTLHIGRGTMAVLASSYFVQW